MDSKADGVKYTAKTVKRGTCNGCAAFANDILCDRLPALLAALQSAYDMLSVSYPLHSSDMDRRAAAMHQARTAIERATK